MSGYTYKHVFPTCPECKQHKILSPHNIRCGHCKSRRNLKAINDARKRAKREKLKVE